MKCSFCKQDTIEGVRKMYILKTGQVFYFCDSKCQRNYKLNRRPAKTKWVTKKRK